jgi:hypothetical protein
MLPTSARVDVLSPPRRRGVARAAHGSRWPGGPVVTGGRDCSDGTASGNAGR